MPVAPMSDEQVREAVQARYAAAARVHLTDDATGGCGCGEACRSGSHPREQAVTIGCCDPGCCGETAKTQPIDPISSGLYDEADTPFDAALAASLGCGNPTALAQLAPGEDVLDLGSGGGLDVLLSARRVAPGGTAYGLDMTPEMLELAERHKAEAGIDNATFLLGAIEQVPLPDRSVDVVISNCVINLSPDKAAVLKGARALLKPGGEMYFSDVYADRRLPDAVRQDAVLLGECLGGALYWGDFLDISESAGFGDARLVTSRTMSVDDPVLAARCGAARFYSATYRLFNIDGLEPRCEDYGQAVVYKGGIPGHEDVFQLDTHHRIEKGKVFPVCGNTYRMLMESRFAPFFDAFGDFSTHYGIFPGCGTQMPLEEPAQRPAKVAVATMAGATNSGGGCC